MATRLEQLIVELRADVKGYHAELQKSARATQSWSREVGESANFAKRAFSGILAGLSVAGFAAVTKSSVEFADGIQKAADVANITTEQVQELRFAFSQLAEVTDTQVDETLRRFNRRLGLARDGSESYRKTMRALGVDLRGDTSQALEQAIQGLARIENGADRAAAASVVFGDDVGPKMAAALGHGEAAVARLRDQFRRDGGLIPNEQIEQAGRLKEEWERLRTILTAQTAKTILENSESLNLLAAGMAKVVGAAISGAGHVANFARWVGEELAVALHGVSADDIPRLTGQLVAARAELERLETALQSPDLAAAETVRRGLTRRLEEQAEAKRQEIESLERQIEMASQRQRERDAALKNQSQVGSGAGGGESATDDAKEWKLRRAAALHSKALMDEEAREIQQNQRIIDLQQERFRRIHEMALRAQGQDVELEQFRYAEEQRKLQEDMDRLRERGLLTQEIEDQFRAAREEAELIHRAKLTEIDEKEAEKRLDVERSMHQMRLNMAEQIAASLEAAAKDGSALQKTLFFAQKAIAFARVGVDTQVAAMRALADLGPVAGPPMAASIRLQGRLAQALIAGQAIAGIAHSGLGSVPREGTYLLNQGERVVAPEQNRDLTNFLRGGGGSSKVTVIVNEAPGGNVASSVSHSADPNGNLTVVIDQRIRQVMRNDIRSGRGVAMDLQQTFGLTRKGTI